MRRILVCGGRNYYEREGVYQALDAYEASMVIAGGATGADSLARDWAENRGVPCMIFPAAWRKYGKSAGPRRNAWMLKFGRPDLVMAFPGGRGTANMTSAARKAGVSVVEMI